MKTDPRLLNSDLDKKMKNVFFGISCIVLVGFDLTTKWLAQTYLANKPLEIIPGIFRLNFNANTGIAFSVPVPNFTMIILTPILLAVLIFLILKQCNIGSPITKTILVLFVAGGFGNLINRLTEGAVIDFISLSFWPSFNLADSYLVIAALLLLALHGKMTVKS